MFGEGQRFRVRRVQYWNAPDRFHVVDLAREAREEAFNGRAAADWRCEAKNADYRRYLAAMWAKEAAPC